jgi:hypothetical protein
MPLKSILLARGLKLKFIGGPQSNEKMLNGPKFTRKPLKYAEFDQNLQFLGCSRAAQMHLAGRVFETPAPN